MHITNCERNNVLRMTNIVSQYIRGAPSNFTLFTWGPAYHLVRRTLYLRTAQINFLILEYLFDFWKEKVE